MTSVLVILWRIIRGPFQWRILWLLHHKFIIGVSGVILDKQDQVLLLRHKYWKQGSWGLPSGYAERQEKLEETLIREVKEETRYDVGNFRLIRIVSGYKLRIEVNFVGDFLGGELKLDPKEVIEARFFSRHELPEGLLPSHRELIEHVFQ